MAVNVELDRLAERKLDALIDEIAKDSPAGARRLLSEVRKVITRLSEFPLSCPQIGADPRVRHALAGRRIHLFYVVRAGGVRIYDIVYAGHDPAAIVEPPPA